MLPSSRKISPIFFALAFLLLLAQDGIAAQGNQDQGPSSQVRSGIPQLIKFASRLGEPARRNGTVGITFAIYAEQQGGAALWQETQNVTVDDQGRYSVLLGAASSDGVPADLFVTEAERWLGVQVQLPGESEQARVMLVSVPYAYRAQDATSLGGRRATEYVLREQLTNWSGVIGTPQASSQAPGGITPAVVNGTLNFLGKFTPTGADIGSSQVFDNGSGVGIGTQSPAALFHVARDANMFNDAGAGAIFSAGTNPTQRLVLGYDPAVNAGFIQSTQVGVNVRPLVFNPAGGAVGLGITAPVAIMHVAQDSAATSDLSAGLIVGHRSTPAKRMMFGFDAGLDAGYLQSTHAGVNVKPFLLNPFGGNVGIGTSVPLDALHVQGTVRAAGGMRFGDGTLQTTAISTGTLQQRVTGTCAAGSSIRTINQDGTVVCETDDSGAGGAGTVTSVATGTGLTGGPITTTGTISLNTTFTDGRYLSLTGGTLTGNLAGNTAVFSASVAGAPNEVVRVTQSGGGHGIVATSTATGAVAVSGQSGATSGFAVGVDGISQSSGGVGVRGQAFAVTGQTTGVLGTVASSTILSAGVRGEATSASGEVFGVRGISASATDNATGVRGEATATTGATVGVRGTVVSTSAFASAIHGDAQGTTGATYAVRGTNGSTSGTGVLGSATAATGSTVGVSGTAASIDGNGVLGEATSTTGSSANGVVGVSRSNAGRGVSGFNSSASGVTFGVHGQVKSTSGFAGYFDNDSGGVILTGRTNALERFRVDGTGAVRANSYRDLASSKNAGLLPTCTAGQVMKVNPGGTDWQCDNDATSGGGGTGDITDVIAGSGLTGGATSGSAVLSANFPTAGGDNGTASTVARGDHLHDSRYLQLSGGSLSGAVTVSNGGGQFQFDGSSIGGNQDRILRISKPRSGGGVFGVFENTAPFSSAGVVFKTPAATSEWQFSAHETGGGAAEGLRLGQFGIGTYLVMQAGSGNVGIGTNPLTILSNKLAVSGSVGANSFLDLATQKNVGLRTDCSTGQIMKWNGSVWQCDADTSGSGGGGTVTQIGTGTGLIGGPITTTGLLSIDTSVVPRLNVANTFVGTNTFTSASTTPLKGDTSGVVNAVEGVSSGASGVYGITFASGTALAGVKGEAINGQARGVLGTSTAFDGAGVVGRVTGTGAAGVIGEAVASSGITVGVKGTTASSSGFAGYFDNTAGGTIISGRQNTAEVFRLNSIASPRLQVTGDIRVGTSGTNGCIQNFAGTGILGICSSDARLKKNIRPFASVLDRLVQLRPVKFDWRVEEHPEYHFGPGRNSGLVAQEVEKVFPEMVAIDERGFKLVDYSELPYLTLQAVKELKSENDALKEQNLELRRAIERQEARLQALESRLAPASDLGTGKKVKVENR